MTHGKDGGLERFVSDCKVPCNFRVRKRKGGGPNDPQARPSSLQRREGQHLRRTFLGKGAEKSKYSVIVYGNSRDVPNGATEDDRDYTGIPRGAEQD